MGDVASKCTSAPEAPPLHKLLIFRGKLLDHDQTLHDAGLVSGCVLHLTLNEAQSSGKPLYAPNPKRHDCRTPNTHTAMSALGTLNLRGGFPQACEGQFGGGEDHYVYRGLHRGGRKGGDCMLPG